MKRILKKAFNLGEKTLQYNLLRHLKTLPPKEMQINVNFRCNSRCIMCNIWKAPRKKEMTYDEWQDILQDPIFSSIEKLVVSGGEPTLRSDLVDLVELFIASMPRLKHIDLTTNGFVTKKIVADVKKIANLANKNKLNFAVSVSLDGAGDMHQKIRRIPKAFEKTAGTILKLKNIQPKYGFWLGAACVISRKNLYQLKPLEQWAEKHDVSLNFMLVGFHPTYVQNTDKEKKLRFQDRDGNQLFKILEKLSKPKSWHRPVAYYWKDMLEMYKKGELRTTPCQFPVDAFVLDCNGDVYYCLSSKKVGNVLEKGKSVSDVYYDTRNITYRKNLTKGQCLNCNSVCLVDSAIKKDLKKFLWFYLTGKTGSQGVV